MSSPQPAKPLQAVPKSPAASAAGAASPTPQATLLPQTRKLKKGELIFSEGDTSRAMYFIKSGMIRVFKKKAESCIEIDTLRAGSVLGELAFLDGNPRSASAEALTEGELVEVTGPAFQGTMDKLPDWLKILMKTIVGRLRAASTRIRQLENAQTSMSYADKDGARELQYVFLTPSDVLKGSSALILVAAKNGSQSGNQVEIKESLYHRYGNQIMNVPVAKLTALLDVFNQCGITIAGGEDGKILVSNLALLEQFVAYYNDQNLLEPSKRQNLSPRGFVVTATNAKYLHNYTLNAETGVATVNVGEILKKETVLTKKEPFRGDEFEELVKLNVATALKATSTELIETQIKSSAFMHFFRMHKVMHSILDVNNQKASNRK